MTKNRLEVENDTIYVAVKDNIPEMVASRVSFLKMSMEMVWGETRKKLVYDIYKVKLGDVFEHVEE